MKAITTKTVQELVPRVLAEVLGQPMKVELPITSCRTFLSAAAWKHRPETIKAFQASHKFASDINRTAPYWLVLLGPSGVGKTRLAKAVWKAFMQERRFEVGLDKTHYRIVGNTGQFVQWRKLCAAVREGSWGWVDDICDDWFVVLDDLGSEYDRTGFIASIIDRVIEGRQGKWTLVTSNLLMDQIAEQIDPRIASRMIRNNAVVVQIDAKDFSLVQP